jgi:hypothetical protein
MKTTKQPPYIILKVNWEKKLALLCADYGKRIINSKIKELSAMIAKGEAIVK